MEQRFSSPDDSPMKRTLGSFDILCLGLNAIVGSGIFLLPDDLYREMGPASPLAFLACAAGLWPIALCYSEAAAETTETGGPYEYTRKAFGPSAAFCVGWMCFTNSLFSFAAVAGAAAASLNEFSSSFGALWIQKAIAVFSIAAFSLLNYLGARPGARVVNTFTVVKFAVLLVLVCALLPQLGHGAALATTSLSWRGFGNATFMAVFAAQGFEVAPVPAGETRDPKRQIPRAILGSLAAASLLYFVVQSVLVFSYRGLGNVSDAPLSEAALAVTPSLGWVVAAGGLVSMLGFVSGTAFGTPRYLYAAARQGELSPVLGALHPRFGSPHFAIIATASAAILVSLPFDYRSLLGMSNVAVAVQYIATCLAVLHRRLQLRAASESLSVARLGSLVLRSLTATRLAMGPLFGCAMGLWIVCQASLIEMVWACASLVCGLALRAALVSRTGVANRT